MPGGTTIDDLARDPHPHLAALRPVGWVDVLGGVVVSGRAAALDVLRDPETFTVDDPRFSTAQVVGPSMLSLDGAAHDGHRTPFVPPFRPREITARFTGFVTTQVGRRLSALVDRGDRWADLRSELAAPVAASVVAEALGLDGADDAVAGLLTGWYRDIVASVSGITAGKVPSAAGREAMSALSALLRDRGFRAHPLTTDEAVSNAAVILFGGIETTEGMISNALWHLLVDPARADEVRADPELVLAAVEESLRLEPAAARVDRYATRTATVAGTEIAAGDLVIVSLAGANRDPEEFPDPDRFDLHRPNVRRHLAFAAGPHVCVGMDLARLEARVAVTAVFDRLPGVRLDEDAPPPTGLVFRKPDRLPVRW